MSANDQVPIGIHRIHRNREGVPAVWAVGVACLSVGRAWGRSLAGISASSLTAAPAATTTGALVVFMVE